MRHLNWTHHDLLFLHEASAPAGHHLRWLGLEDPFVQDMVVDTNVLAKTCLAGCPKELGLPQHHMPQVYKIVGKQALAACLMRCPFAKS